MAVLSTGNELLDVQSPNPLPSDGWGGIWDTNRPSLQATLEGLGYEVVDLGIVPDRFVSPSLSLKHAKLTTKWQVSMHTSQPSAVASRLPTSSSRQAGRPWASATSSSLSSSTTSTAQCTSGESASSRASRRPSRRFRRRTGAQSVYRCSHYPGTPQVRW